MDALAELGVWREHRRLKLTTGLPFRAVLTVTHRDLTVSVFVPQPVVLYAAVDRYRGQFIAQVVEGDMVVREELCHRLSTAARRARSLLGLELRQRRQLLLFSNRTP